MPQAPNPFKRDDLLEVYLESRQEIRDVKKSHLKKYLSSREVRKKPFWSALRFPAVSFQQRYAAVTALSIAFVLTSIVGIASEFAAPDDLKPSTLVRGGIEQVGTTENPTGPIFNPEGFNAFTGDLFFDDTYSLAIKIKEDSYISNPKYVQAASVSSSDEQGLFLFTKRPDGSEAQIVISCVPDLRVSYGAQVEYRKVQEGFLESNQEVITPGYISKDSEPQFKELFTFEDGSYVFLAQFSDGYCQFEYAKEDEAVITQNIRIYKGVRYSEVYAASETLKKKPSVDNTQTEQVAVNEGQIIENIMLPLPATPEVREIASIADIPQEVISQSGGIPSWGITFYQGKAYWLNYTPGDFATDEVVGRSLYSYDGQTLKILINEKRDGIFQDINLAFLSDTVIEDKVYVYGCAFVAGGCKLIPGTFYDTTTNTFTVEYKFYSPDSDPTISLDVLADGTGGNFIGSQFFAQDFPLFARFQKTPFRTNGTGYRILRDGIIYGRFPRYEGDVVNGNPVPNGNYYFVANTGTEYEFLYRINTVGGSPDCLCDDYKLNNRGNLVVFGYIKEFVNNSFQRQYSFTEYDFESGEVLRTAEGIDDVSKDGVARSFGLESAEISNVTNY